MQSDQDAKVFLKRVMNTISAVLVWGVLNIMLGIYFGFALVDGKPIWINIAYYIVLISSLIALVKILKRIWK